MKVNKLIIDSTKSWNISLLNMMFEPNTIENILRITLPYSDEEINYVGYQPHQDNNLLNLSTI